MGTKREASENNPVNVHSRESDAQNWADRCNRDSIQGWHYVAERHTTKLADGSEHPAWAVNAYRDVADAEATVTVQTVKAAHPDATVRVVIGYSASDGHSNEAEYTDPGAAWAALRTMGRIARELSNAIEAAASTGYALQTETFTGTDTEGINHTITVLNLDTHTRDGHELGEAPKETTHAGADDAAQAETERRRRYYAMRRPVLERTFPENVVTQGDADYCRDFGHAAHTVDGVDTGTCPRCGNVTPEAYDAGRAITQGTEVEYLHDATQTWRRATVESFRPSDAAYILRTAYGTDAAPARHVHTLMPDGTSGAEGPVCAACGDATCTARGAHHTVTELPRAGATLGAPVLAVGDAVNYHAEHSSDWKSGTIQAVSIGLQAVVITTPDGGDDVALLRNVHRLES